MLPAGHESDPVERWLGACVVLDTQGPLIFIGVLESVEATGFWLADADVHDRTDGQSTKERYVNDAAMLHRAGARAMNRRRVFVDRQAVVSASLLDDVLAEGEPQDRDRWWLDEPPEAREAREAG